MSITIASSFFDATNALQKNERAQVLTFLAKFFNDPTLPSFSYERLRYTHPSNQDIFWSARVTDHLRAIIYQEDAEKILLHVGHHDAAYHWAKKRYIKRHKETQILQVLPVETPQLIENNQTEIKQTASLFAHYDDATLLKLGLPEAYLDLVRNTYNQEQLWSYLTDLPEDIAEYLLQISEGKTVTPAASSAAWSNPQQRRHYWHIEEENELLSALQGSLARWLHFLHPSQLAIVEGAFSGAVKISGAAGTGKTIVALHRARYLAQQGEKVLLTSPNVSVIPNLHYLITQLCQPTELKNIQVSSLVEQAWRHLHVTNGQKLSEREVQAQLFTLAKKQGIDKNYSLTFLWHEWLYVIEANNITDLASYQKIARSGRVVRLSSTKRQSLWQLFAALQEQLKNNQHYTSSQILRLAAEKTPIAPENAFTAVIVDEMQDCQLYDLQWIKKLSAAKPENLMLVGDHRQRHYPGGYRLSDSGIAVRGRSRTLKVNYRTTAQIRRCAEDILLSDSQPFLQHLLEEDEENSKSISIIRGLAPQCLGSNNAEEAIEQVLQQLYFFEEKLSTDLEECGIFYITDDDGTLLKAALEQAGYAVYHFDEHQAPEMIKGAIHLAPISAVKGLEYKCVILFGAQHLTIHDTGENALERNELKLLQYQQRQQLYIALSRARDALFINWYDQKTDYLQELQKLIEEEK